MDLDELQRHWNEFGRRDPMWAILAIPDRANGNWDAKEFFTTGEREIAEALRYVDSLGVPYGRRRALDFGCGVGRLSQALCRHFDEVHGVDIAPSMVELARQFNRFGDRCRYHVNERDDLRLFDDGTFDFIYSVIALQHMEPRYSSRYIEEFVRVLRPGGILLFQIPSEPVAGTGADRVRGGGTRSPVGDRAAGTKAQGPASRARSGRSASGWLSRLVRRTRARWSREARLQRLEPRMEMHGISRDAVVELLEKSAGRVVDVRPDTWPGPAWVSFIYTVTKDE